ncbi:nitronate monooxygenase [Salsuginibacillus halophilus]|uniref:Probable nitronate monooxygenase n=1 Tax=Salsuginibacillus halophilus TaxID=517424 RepID=A0A2P8HLG1_9BACI|nr:nitronate monooxygenase [Salsuginibacillus halophilus]PSL47062.1 nitronate monooxygenase [Salsuginibacillus halophilus]
MNDWRTTTITKMLNIELPIIQAGMAGGITSPALVAAVSNAGGLGSIGAGYMSGDALDEALTKVKRSTDKPFSVNLFVPEYPENEREAIQFSKDQTAVYREKLNLVDAITSPYPDQTLFAKQIEIVKQHNVPVVSFTFGLPPAQVVQALKAAGITLIGTATTVDEGVANEAAGMDMVVAQGSEAGGHRGTFNTSFSAGMIGTMSLVPQMCDHVHIPVVAAGGIMDGRTTAASLMLGARAVQLGTAFVTAEESSAHPLHKAHILKSKESDTVITKAFSGKPARGLANQFIRDMVDFENDFPTYPIQHHITAPIRKAAADQNKPELMSLWSGQSPRLSSKHAVHEIIETITKDTDKLLGNV